MKTKTFEHLKEMILLLLQRKSSRQRRKWCSPERYGLSGGICYRSLLGCLQCTYLIN